MRLSSAGISYRPSPPKMPPGLVELMEGLTREVLKHNPTDVYGFCAGHMQNLLEVRDGPIKKKSLTVDEKIYKAQLKVRERAVRRRQEFDKALVKRERSAGNDEEITNLLTEETSAQNAFLPSVLHEQDLSQSHEIETSHVACENKELENETNVTSSLAETEKSSEVQINSADKFAKEDIKGSSGEGRATDSNIQSSEITDNALNDAVIIDKVTNSDDKTAVIIPCVVDTIVNNDSNKDQQQHSSSTKTVPADELTHISSPVDLKHGDDDSEKPSEIKDETLDVNIKQNNDKYSEKDSAVLAQNEETPKIDSDSIMPLINDSEIQKITVTEELTNIPKNDEATTPIDDGISLTEKYQITEELHKLEHLEDETKDIPLSHISDNVCISSENIDKENTATEISSLLLNDVEGKNVKDDALNITQGEISQQAEVLSSEVGSMADDKHQNINADYLGSTHIPVHVDSKHEQEKNEENQICEEDTNDKASGDKELYLEHNLTQDDSNKVNVKSSSLTNSIPEDGSCDVPITEANDSFAQKDLDKSITDQILDNNISVKENHDRNMDLETAAVTIQKVFRTFLFKSRGSTFEDNRNEEDHFSDEESEKQEGEYPSVVSMNKERRHHGINRMDTVLQTVNEEKSLSLSTDDSSTLSSAATIIQAHVRGFLVRNKLNSNKTLSTNSLAASNSHDCSLENDNDQQKNKTVLNIHIVPESNFLSRDESLITSVDLSLDGSPPSSINLHPLSERRKQLKREDAIQSVSPPSNNSGKLSEDVDSVKELLNVDELTSDVQQTVEDGKTTQNIKVTRKDADNKTSDYTTGNDSVETAVEITKLENIKLETTNTSPINSCEKEKSLSKLSSDEMDVVTPFASKDGSAESKLMHSGEFHDAVLPTRVSRSDTPVVRGE